MQGKKQTMKFCMIIFVFVLTSLPMMFSTCTMSRGNYVSNSIADLNRNRHHFFKLKSIPLTLMLIFFFVFRWYCGRILHEKSNGYVSFQYNLKSYVFRSFLTLGFSFVKRYELTNQCLHSKQHVEQECKVFLNRSDVSAVPI